MTNIIDTHEITTTHHMVDNVEPQDEAMDTFRQHFRLVAGCTVSKDGKRMKYILRGHQQSVWHRCANNIIKALNLPLAAELKNDKVGTVLIIIYKP